MAGTEDFYLTTLPLSLQHETAFLKQTQQFYNPASTAN